jgi:2-polyprenyl-6-methoxyphenol hydroxylase-like FAD-dependent oxidoreductase
VGARTVDIDVLIVGGGIAGAALACALRWRGWRIAIVEQRRARLDAARGDHLQPCNVDLLADWGVLDRFLAIGAGRRIGHEFRTASGEPLLAARYDELPIRHPYCLVVNHDLIAEVLVDAAAESPHVQRYQPVVARHYEVDASGVVALTIETPDEGQIRLVPCLVVGADGTNSPLRAALGFTYDEHHYRHPMVAMFGARPPGLEPADYFFRYASDRGMLVIQQRMDGSIKVTLPVGEEGIGWWKKSSAGNRAAVVGDRAHVLAEFDGAIAGFYPVRMVHTHRYVRGNTVLVGDAAHSIHPARGQGLNLGIASLGPLIARLPAGDALHDPAQLAAALLDYEAFLKPRYDQTLARNHDAALAMDETAAGDVASLMRAQDAQLRRIHTDPDLRRAHLLDVTGFPFGLPTDRSTS